MKILKHIAFVSAFFFSMQMGHAESLRIAVTPSSIPFSFLDENGKQTGFNVDIAQALCEKLQASCELETIRFPEIMPKVKAGELDIALPNMLKTPEREAQVAFSIPYWRSTSSFVGPVDFFLGSTKSLLKSEKVCAISKTRQINYLKLKNGGATGNIVETSTNKETIEALLSGKCKVILLPTMQSLTFLQSEKGSGFGYLGKPLGAEGLGGTVHIIVRPDREELLEQVDQALLELIREGTHARITRKYFPFGIL